jgi:hypothetical protein
MLALALLTVLTTRATSDATETSAVIALTVAETRRLLNAFVVGRPLTAAHILHWSQWRRRVQARAQRSHYQRRLRYTSNRPAK